MEVLGRVVAGLVGVALVVAVLDSAIRTFVLPRGTVVMLTRLVSVGVRRVFEWRAHLTRTYEARDRVMALYVPFTLFGLVVVWLVMLMVGFTLLFRAAGVDSWRLALEESGSSLFTLGFARPPDLPGVSLVFIEAAIGLAILALLIAYLPTIYSGFSRREALVFHLSSRAGTPPTPVELLTRAHRINRLDRMDELWEEFQLWFAELEETHTSIAFLNFLRSSTPHRSWITAAGAVLDTAALVNSTVDTPWQPMAGLCVRSGFTSLRAIADFFGIPYDADPAPDDPISVAREEFDGVYDQLVANGVPVKPDRDQAWRDFAGWRVNYDRVLVSIAGLIAAPYGLWSSDRSMLGRVKVAVRRSRRPM